MAKPSRRSVHKKSSTTSSIPALLCQEPSQKPFHLGFFARIETDRYVPNHTALVDDEDGRQSAHAECPLGRIGRVGAYGGVPHPEALRALRCFRNRIVGAADYRHALGAEPR